MIALSPRWRCWLVALALPLLAGCGKPFMGVAEWREVKIGDENPQAALRGAPKMTAVHETEYKNYIRSVMSGQIVAAERRGDWQYFALANQRCVPLKATGMGEPAGAMVTVIERYKVKVPPRAGPPSTGVPPLPSATAPRISPATSPKTLTQPPKPMTTPQPMPGKSG